MNCWKYRETEGALWGWGCGWGCEVLLLVRYTYAFRVHMVLK